MSELLADIDLPLEQLERLGIVLKAVLGDLLDRSPITALDVYGHLHCRKGSLAQT